MIHKGHIAVWLGLKKKQKTKVRRDENKYFFPSFLLKWFCSDKKLLEEKTQHSSFKNVVAMQDSEKAFSKFSFFSSLKSKMVAKELTGVLWMKCIQLTLRSEFDN